MVTNIVRRGLLIDKRSFRRMLEQVLTQRLQQGCALDEASVLARIAAAQHSYDALYEVALALRSPPMRADWPWCEPLAWAEIVAESDQLNPDAPWPRPDLARAADKARSAFLGSVCGCMLGKPIEVDPTLAELKRAGESCGEWPIRDYISANFLDKLGRRHDSWPHTVRQNIRAVVADDDIHYSLLGMLLLEEHGTGFTSANISRLWQMNLPPLWTWGPERTALIDSALRDHHVAGGGGDAAPHDVLFLNPGDEYCGALIRADAYGYACPGNPDLAAWLAFKDASFTHVRTGVYGAMFTAALIALCHGADGSLRDNHRLALVEEALKRVPSRTRFASVVRDSMERVSKAANWEDAYSAIHGNYREFSHCRVYQEIGTLINSLRFARSVDHGFCIQVSQGNDTDSFGATAGSVLGALYGMDGLDARWLRPFQNRLLHGLADFHHYDLLQLADRMGQLPGLVYASHAPRELRAP